MTEPTEAEETLATAAAGPEQDRQTVISSIAAQLVKAREASGQSIEDVMRDLKLRRIYLEALESGNWDDMPGQVYALGFLRQYAAHLHLDLENEIALLKDGQYRLTKPLTYPDPPIAPSRKWALGIGVAFVVLFILFNITGHDETENTAPPAELATPRTTPAPTAATDNVPASEGETAMQAMQSPVIAPEAAAPAVTTAGPAEADSGSTAAMHRIDLEAVDSEAWLEIYLPDADGNAGNLYKQKLLQAGEHLLIDTAIPELLITCGNAAGLQISVDGKLRVAAGSLGKPGKVIRDYRLEIENTPASQSDLSD